MSNSAIATPAPGFPITMERPGPAQGDIEVPLLFLPHRPPAHVCVHIRGAYPSTPSPGLASTLPTTRNGRLRRRFTRPSLDLNLGRACLPHADTLKIPALPDHDVQRGLGSGWIRRGRGMGYPRNDGLSRTKVGLDRSPGYHPGTCLVARTCLEDSRANPLVLIAPHL